MEKHIITTGKTIDLAIEAALAQLGLDRDSVSVQVLAQAKSSFFGFGGSPAKVQVTYEAEDPVPEAPKTALSSASRTKKPVPAVAKSSKPTTETVKPKVEPVKSPKPAAETAKPKMEEPTRRPETAPQRPKPETPKQARQPRETPLVKEPREPMPPKAPKVYAPAEPGSTEERIEQFLKGLLERMGSQAVPHAWKGENDIYQVALTGEDLGFLIGHRGETLDAIQHLCNYVMNRNAESRLRVNVDAESYREKRMESLRRYARKKAQQVLKARRRVTLEPMNAYERHVIHATLQEMENITTHSTGTEPNRRVVIEYVR